MSKLQMSVLKVVVTRSFEAQKIGASSQRFDILCRNDEARDLQCDAPYRGHPTNIFTSKTLANQGTRI